jgi:NADPH:quinone reductase
MKAVTVEPEGRLAIREHDDPEAGVGEVLVRIRAAGVNNTDLGQRAGLYPAPPGSPPDIPGLEFAGEVVAVGPSASRFLTGARVMAVVGGGAQAELIAVHERQLMPVPEGLNWTQAGGFAEAFVTAHDALFTQAGLRPGKRVLINGAAGGVGVAGSAPPSVQARCGRVPLRKKRLRRERLSVKCSRSLPEAKLRCPSQQNTRSPKPRQPTRLSVLQGNSERSFCFRTPLPRRRDRSSTTNVVSSHISY